MITPENITRKQAKKLVKLIKEWSYAEAMRRMGRFDNLTFMQYSQTEIEKRDEIRKMLFDESEIAILAERWGIIKKKRRKKKRKNRED